MKNRQHAFTIVELLIVVVVIAILAALVLNSFAGAQAKARDAKRTSDIKELAKAIEMYYAEKGNYPMSSGWCTHISNLQNGWGAAFQSEMAPYISQMPFDPLYEGTFQEYFYRNVGDQTFYLYAELEESDRPDDGFSGCARIDGIDNEYDYRYPDF